MKLRKPLAGVLTSALIFGGAVLGAGAANAAEGDLYVPSGSIELTTGESEASLYNSWHFDPAKSQVVTDQTNGILVPAGPDVAILKGNGNNVADAPADD